MTVISQILFVTILLPIWASSKEIRFTDRLRTVQDFPVEPIPSTEYQPMYGGTPDQDLSAESIGIEFEDSIIRSMLQIVDVKFNTLSTRMISLERGINSLQVYLSRQFRHVTKNLQAVNIVMNSLHAEVSHVDMETRSVRNSLLALNKEFLDYRNRNLGVFRELRRDGQKTLPVDGVDDSHKNLNQSQHTSKREIDVESNTSGKPIFLSSFTSSEEIAGGLGNDSINMKYIHTHIEKGFSKLNETVSKRFDDLYSVTGIMNENLDIVRDNVVEINNTLANSLTNQDTIQDGINYLKNMVEFLTEKQDYLLMDVSFLKEESQRNFPGSRTGAGQFLRSSDDPQCQKTSSDKNGSIDLKSEFEKISDKLDLIDNRADELNDNIVHTSDVLEESRNHTEHVVKLVEALSGSTIWIPHILREVKMTAKYLNQSINATYLVYKKILGSRSDTPPSDQLSGIADGKMGKSEHYQNVAPSTPCKIDEEDTKLMRHQISKVEEILEELKNSSTSKTDSKKDTCKYFGWFYV